MKKKNAIKSIIEPTFQAAINIVKDCVAKQKMLLLVGSCRVDYEGRAESKLGLGDRVLIIKEDGATLVHRPTGYEPVNWQPPGCIFHVNAAGNNLQIKAVRRKPRESVKISFERVYLVSVMNLVDKGEFVLHASEEDMQKAVLLAPSLVEDGLKPIAFEKKVEPGFVDVYCEDKVGRLVVIEIKRKTAAKEAALQLARYVEAVRGIVNKDVRGILAAPSLGKGVQRLLATLGLEFKALDPRKCAEVLRQPETKRLAEFFGGK